MADRPLGVETGPRDTRKGRTALAFQTVPFGQLREVAQRVALRPVAFDDGVSAAMVTMQCSCFLSFAACFIGVVSKTGATIAALLYAYALEWWVFVKKWYKGSVGRWSSSESTMRSCGGSTRMAKRQSIQKNKRLAFVMAATIICAVAVT